MPTKKLKNLMDKAKDNTTISKKTSDGVEVIKNGVPNDHSVKHTPYEGAKIGMSKGVTKNMDNYESLRVDVWLSDEVQPGETISEAYDRIGSVLDKTLEEAVLSSIGEE